jgi:hypothetical protein
MDLKHLHKLFSVVVFACCVTGAEAKLPDLKPSQMREVIRIAKAISVVQPFLDEGKDIQYAWGIYHASERYNVEPEVLIAITEQETTFRENLPEGRAGELGICQIRKNWMKNTKFHAEFPRAVAKDLFKPSKSFMFAAWILHGLKEDTTNHTLPYWSYYNSVRFENRFKYFLAVNKNISVLKKWENYINSVARDDDRQLAEAPRPIQTFKADFAAINRMAQSQRPRLVQPVPTPKVNPVLVVAQNTPMTSTGVQSRWISNALNKIQQQQKSDNKKSQPTSIMRTAQELGVSNFYSQASVQD